MVKITAFGASIEIQLGIKERLRRARVKSQPVPIHGALVHISAEHMLPKFVEQHPFYDSALPAITLYLWQSLKRPLIIMDVGANIGDTAAIIAAAVTPSQIQFICVEADTNYLPLLEKNTNGLQAELVHAIAGAKSGRIDSRPVATGTGSSAIEEGGAGARVVSLDDLAKSRQIDLLKIDTDGYELEVLKGARDVLSQEALTVYLEYMPLYVHKYGKSEPRSVLDLMMASGFKRVVAYDNLGYILGIFDLNDYTIDWLTAYAIRRPGYYYDLLFSKDAAFLESCFARETDRMNLGKNTD